jgi:DNA-binding MarR family transcriptional regulator
MTKTTPDPVTQEIIALFAALAEQMRSHFTEVNAQFGLSAMEGRALFDLAEPMPMGELANQLRCDASYITGITDRLEGQGLVVRQANANDRRVKHLTLTNKGKQIREAMLLQAEQQLPATAGLTKEQCLALRDLLRATQRGNKVS